MRVHGLRVCVRIANSSQSCPSQLAQGAHHVEHYACLASLTEMQIVSDHDVEQIIRSQSAIARRFDVIAGHKEFLLTVRSREDAGFGIIGAVSEKLQSQKRMSGPAFS